MDLGYAPNVITFQIDDKRLTWGVDDISHKNDCSKSSSRWEHDPWSPADLRQISHMADSTSCSISGYKFYCNIKQKSLSYCPQMRPKPRLKVVTRNCGSKCCTAAMPVPRTRKTTPISYFLFSFLFIFPRCILFAFCLPSW